MKATTPAAVIRMTQRANDLQWHALSTGDKRSAWLAQQMRARAQQLVAAGVRV